MKNLKQFESFHSVYKEDDYVTYKRYLGFPPIIVKILKINKSNQYFVEQLESPHNNWVVNRWELDELTEEDQKELDMYLDSQKYNV